MGSCRKLRCSREDRLASKLMWGAIPVIGGKGTVSPRVPTGSHTLLVGPLVCRGAGG